MPSKGWVGLHDVASRLLGYLEVVYCCRRCCGHCLCACPCQDYVQGAETGCGHEPCLASTHIFCVLGRHRGHRVTHASCLRLQASLRLHGRLARKHPRHRHNLAGGLQRQEATLLRQPWRLYKHMCRRLMLHAAYCGCNGRSVLRHERWGAPCACAGSAGQLCRNNRRLMSLSLTDPA